MSVKDLLLAVRAGALSPEQARAALDAQAAPADPLREPIAIVGMSGRYPQAASLDEYWQLLREGRDAVREIPASRWNLHDYFDPTPPRVGKMYAKWLGSLEDVDAFDPLFFAISPGEAAQMDPQHRLFMQEAYRAFEDAGYAGDALSGMDCGVYFGIMSREYGDLLIENPQHGVSITGISSAIGAARISYCLNLKGPAIPVDTACSSSLVAVHLACQALRLREIDMALCGGATLYLSPGAFIGLCTAGMLSPTGHCRAFDDGADGFTPGEGVGALILKRLSDAEAAQDHIHGLILASGINQDGRTNGLTAPCKASQVELTRGIYRRYGINPETLGYVEMHGTGTSLGDPIELSALATTFREYTSRTGFCAIGSVKSNLGHTSAAAGVAGIQKVLLCMRHGTLVPTLHFQTPNRHFDFTHSPFRVSTRVEVWPRLEGRPRRAAVSSFGYSGTNAHLVLQEYIAPHVLPAEQATGTAATKSDAQLVLLSALDENALRRNVTALLLRLQTGEAPDLADLAYTLQVGRAHREVRLALLVSSTRRLMIGLDAYLARRSPPGLHVGDGERSPVVDRLADSDDLGDMQRDWFYNDPTRLLELWSKGLDADWRDIRRDNPARRIPVPTYRFAEERYWLDFGLDRTPQVLSSKDSTTQLFDLPLSGDEFYLDGHRVAGRRVLPAAQCLEIVRSAVATALQAEFPPLELRGIVWQQPVVLDERTNPEHPYMLRVALDAHDGGWAFALRHGDIAFCRGHARRFEADAGESLPALPDEAGETVDVDALYELFAMLGIDYGLANRGLASLRTTAQQADGWLELPDSAPAGDHHVLHATLLDSALQATLAVALAAAEPGDDGTSLPFALDSLQVFSPTRPRMQVRVRAADTRGDLRLFDLDLVHEDGSVCVRMRGFASRRMRAHKGSSRLDVLVPVWTVLPHEAAPGSTSLNGATLLVGADSDQSDILRARHPLAATLFAPDSDSARGDAQDAEQVRAALTRAGNAIARIYWFHRATEGAPGRAVERLFTVVKALIEAGAGSVMLDWCVHGVGMLAPTPAGTDPDAAALAGLLGTMAKEYPNWRVRVIDADTPRAWSLAELDAAPTLAGGGVAAWRDGRWLAQELAPFAQRGRFDSVYRHGGVYVVIGGAGGVGEAWTEWMLRHYAARIVWLGRRPHDAAIEARQARLATIGARPWYLQADAANQDALDAALAEVRARFGVDSIRGVVHSALVLDDSSLAQMQLRQFRASLRPKIDASMHLASSFAHGALDFVLFFSSLQSFTRAAGQGNYAAGCTFQDACALPLSRALGCPVKVVNWGYWGEVGIVATPEHRARMARIGIGSIDAEEGMQALELLLASPLHQMAVLKSLSPEVVRNLAPSGEQVTWLAARVAHGTVESARTAEPPPVPPALQAAADALLARALQVQLLRSLEAASVGSLSAFEAVIEPLYRRWLAESRRVLQRHGLLGPNDAPIPLPDPEAAWRDCADALRNEPAIAIAVHTMEALPGILRGSLRATDILFSDTSMEQVEGVYRGTPVADYYNAVLGDELLQHLTRRSVRGERLRVLEIGAGTGGTSVLLFDRLSAYGDAVGEYLYTDLSRAFLLHADTHFCPQHPWLKTALLDIERPIGPQGIDIGGYDVVVATNVLHATRDIRRTLRNAKAALKPGGVLLVNEISRGSVFAHLTFGLLQGWWLAEDVALRIEGSPALAPDTWARLLREEGYASVQFPAQAAHGDGQQIVVAFSDGVVRQAASTENDLPALPSVDGPAETSTLDAIPPAPDLRGRVLALVTETIATVLRIPPARLDSRQRLERYGLDSILAVQMTAHLGRILPGVQSTLFMEYQTLDALATHLLATRSADLAALFGIDPAAEPAAVTAAHAASAEAAPSTPPAAVAQAVAIVAISGRFPRAGSVEALWQRLRDGEDCIGEVPAERWDHTPYFYPDRTRIGTTYCRWGGFIDGVDEFDPLFFDISPASADFIDPQVRLLLQGTWDVLEQGGYTRERLERRHGSRVGVFIGAMYQQYQTLAMDYITHAGVSLSSYSAISNRISNFFDFKGPSVAVDTQCSSALIAVHMARQSLVAGECEMAVAGAVNLILSPKKYIGLSIPMMLGSSARCRSFALGDGFLPSEGVGVVLLKPLARAVADGDPVLAVLRGSAQNHGGRALGYGTQNPNAQYELVRRCLQDSGVSARSISVVEAASNGTSLSDAMEISALKRVFGEQTSDEGFCTLGSVKSNLGHSESASGIAQLAKVLMQFKYAKLPPTHVPLPANPDIDLTTGPFRLQATLAPWPRPKGSGEDGTTIEQPRRALIDCFGGGGSLACAVLEEFAPDLPGALAHVVAPRPSSTDQPATRQVLVLSARDDDRLRFASGRLLRHLQYVPGLALADVAYTLQIGREAMSSRLAFVVDSIDATCDILQRLCTGDGTLPPDVWRGDAHRAPAMPAPALVKGDPQRLAAHWAGGGDVDWEALHAGTRARIVALPGYPFEPRRCWLPAMDNDDYAASLARIDDGFAEQAIDAAADPVGTAHAEIASMLGLTTQQLPRDTLLARFEMPHILLPRLQRHLQARLGMALEATALNGCQSVGDVLALLHPQARRARARARVKRP